MRAGGGDRRPLNRLSLGRGYRFAAEGVRLQLNLTLVLIISRFTVYPVNLEEVVDGSAPGGLTKFLLGQFDFAALDLRWDKIIGLGNWLILAHVCLLLLDERQSAPSGQQVKHMARLNRCEACHSVEDGRFRDACWITIRGCIDDLRIPRLPVFRPVRICWSTMEGHFPNNPKVSDEDGSNVVPALWFGVALLPMIVSQVVRLHQHHAGSWIAWDYAGRLCALAILAAIPSARAVAFRWDKRQISLLEIALWIVGLSFLERLSQWPRRIINAAFPATVLGVYPQPTGWLYLIDLVFGLALVAASEEIIFRQCARYALQPFLSSSAVGILGTSLVFGFYHWWAGLGNILLATILGILLAIMLRRSVALWPVALAHYLVDLIAFA